MYSRPKKRRRRLIGRDSGEYWISYSDMLSSLLLVFMLAVTFSIYQYYSLLEIKTKELNAQKAELDQATIILAQQQEELETTRVTLMGKEEELAKIQIQLDEQREDLNAAKAALALKEEEQAALQLLLSQQQKQIDDLLGLRTAIIRELSQALSAADINANVDPRSGDIVLDSKLLFDTGKNRLLPAGEEQLRRLIPVYLQVLLRPEYRDYVAEIIIEGHTDSKGSYVFNLELSQQRALSAATYCLQMPGLSQEQRSLLEKILTAKGRSYADLRYYPDGTENMDASRRVELKFRLKDTEMIQKMNEILTAEEQRP